MTKYLLAFALLLSVTIFNVFFLVIEESPPSEPVVSRGQIHKVQPVSVQDKPKAARLESWKERTYTSYRPYEDKRYRPYSERQKKTASVPKRPSRQWSKDTIVSKGIRYVKIPYKGRHIYVSSDYYSAGGIRKPLTLKQAQKIARQYGAVLPTKEMVDAIWRYADLKLKPQPLKPGPLMTKQVYFVKHDRMIEQQINHRAFALVAGHKKDIIKPRRPGRVTIYGWHKLDGHPIQPPSNVHDDDYGDYANCLRLVKLDLNS